MAENSVVCGELRASRCAGFYRLILPALPHLRLRHRYRRTTNFFCVQQQYEVIIRVNKHKETCYKPSHRTTNKHGETRYRLNAMRKGVTRKNSHSLPERPKLRSAGGPELLGHFARDAQVKPYLEQQNLGELTTAQHKVLIETCEWETNTDTLSWDKIWQLNDP